ncbi:hypothetical protein [Streptomyces sp. YIM 98790]|uniref:GAP1-M domain-containing protein n=1 Tax=Streptomyces sp. YIM 98790 TaxID=2689077 RepID=UPI001407EF08|nr:hypothetical protein [Streptomyces sp. YIM 98790]
MGVEQVAGLLPVGVPHPDGFRRFRYAARVHTGSGAVAVEPAPDDAPGGELPPPEYAAALAPLVAATAPVGDGQLSHTRLPDGSALLCHSRAVAPDSPVRGGTGRRQWEWQHFVVDARYLPGGPAPDRACVIHTWRSACWNADAPAAGNLPQASEEIFGERTLRAFARRHQDRLVPFLTDVHRLFAERAGRQIVLVEEDSEVVALWIALACASLSPAQARALTFVTRAQRPDRMPHQIVGTTPHAAAALGDPAARRYLYRVHDGTGGESSPPEGDADPWAEQVADRWLGRETRPARPASLPAPQSPPQPVPAAREEPARRRERLSRATAFYGADPHRMAGARLFRQVIEQELGGSVTDPDDLRLLAVRCWPHFELDTEGALAILRACPPELIAGADLDQNVIQAMWPGGTLIPGSTWPEPGWEQRAELAELMISLRPSWLRHEPLARARLLVSYRDFLHAPGVGTEVEVRLHLHRAAVDGWYRTAVGNRLRQVLARESPE